MEANQGDHYGLEAGGIAKIKELVSPVNSKFVEAANIGNPKEISVMEPVEKMKEITGLKSEIVFSQMPEDDPLRRCPDISHAKRVLSWEPVVSLEEGLKRTIDWFKQELEAAGRRL